MKIQIIDNWRQIPKMLSAWVAFLCIAYSELLSAEQQAAVLRTLGVPEDKVLGVVGILFLASRMIKQFRPADPPAPGSSGPGA